MNFLKSRIDGLGIDQITLQRFAVVLNCGVMTTPFKYLGLLVGGSHKKGSFWGGVIKKLKSRLCRWKGRLLSLDKRICLIKFVLSSIPLFYMSLYKLSVVVLKEIERIQRQFLWGWRSEGMKIVWASWKKVCESREDKGLGIIDLKDFNLAWKWIWHLGTDKGCFWKDILESKYGGWRRLRDQWINAKESLWWKDLKEV